MARPALQSSRPDEPEPVSLALYPATFDPFTNGHLDVLERALLIFDKVVVGVLKNPAKNPLFSEDERLDMIRETMAGREQVEVSSFHGLTVEYARAIGATTLVRGLRSYSDFDTELRKGDNLYTDAVIALDAATGRMLAYNQMVKRDAHVPHAP